MLLGKEAESEAIVGGKPGIRVSLQGYPTGPVGRFYRQFWDENYTLTEKGSFINILLSILVEVIER